jgi:hypothetical protein
MVLWLLFVCRAIAVLYRGYKMKTVQDLQSRILKEVCSAEVYKIVEDAIETIKFLEAQVGFRNGEVKRLTEMNKRQTKMLEQCGYGE